MKRKILSILLMLPLSLFGLIGCSSGGIDTSIMTNINTIDLMKAIKSSDITQNKELNSNVGDEISSFSMKIFEESIKNSTQSNVIISPISIVNALAMTSNGANGDTLSQMESVFGLTNDEISSYLKTYNNDIINSTENKVNLANSIWFKDTQRLEVREDFLQTNKDFFEANIYKSQFNDETLNDINNWVSENTNGMIENILDELPESAIMYLINAISFEAEWDEIYKASNINEGEFNNIDDTISQVEFMMSEEQKIIELENGIGFIKPYKNSEFSFIGILPNENVTIEKLSNELSNIDFNEVIEEAKIQSTDIIIPKFKMEYSTEMTDMLVGLGIKNAFDSNKADFSNMAIGDGNIYIGQVLHKTYINVDEKGTQAGASTAVEMQMKMSMPMPKDEIRLDRPFIYMIIDNDNNIPIFLGSIGNID